MEHPESCNNTKYTSTFNLHQIYNKSFGSKFIEQIYWKWTSQKTSLEVLFETDILKQILNYKIYTEEFS